MIFDNIETIFEFDPCINYLVTPRLPVQDVTRCKNIGSPP